MIMRRVLSRQNGTVARLRKVSYLERVLEE
jgi:hypothetical protein